MSWGEGDKIHFDIRFDSIRLNDSASVLERYSELSSSCEALYAGA